MILSWVTLQQREQTFLSLRSRVLGVSEPADNSVTSAKIVDGAIVNADINASAAIAGSKISPNFGSQNIVTTGTLGSSDLTITSAAPALLFTETNGDPDYKIQANAGVLKIVDNTNSADRLVVNTDGHVDIAGNLDVGAGIDVTGNITTTGSVYIPDGQIAGFGDVSSPDLRIYHAGGSPGTNIIRGNTTSPLEFWTNSNPRMTIDSSGDVAIGSSTNGGSNRLYVVDSHTDTFVNPSDSILRIENANTSGTTGQASISFTSKTSGSNADSAIVSQAEDASGNCRLEFWTDTSNGMSEKMTIDSSGRALFSGGLGFGNLPLGGNPSNAAIQIRCNSKYNGIAFGENAVSGCIGMGGADTTAAMVFVANAHPANLGGGVHDIFEWHSGTSGGSGPGKYMTLDTSGDLTLEDGDLVIGTSGHGIDFSATSGSGTSELLNDYEEGSCVPTQVNGSFSPGSADGKYTKVGRLVTWMMHINFDSTASGNHLRIGNLPFTAGGGRPGTAMVRYSNDDEAFKIAWHVDAGAATATAYYLDGGAAVPSNAVSSKRFDLTFVYEAT